MDSLLEGVFSPVVLHNSPHRPHAQVSTYTLKCSQTCSSFARHTATCLLPSCLYPLRKIPTHLSRLRFKSYLLCTLLLTFPAAWTGPHRAAGRSDDEWFFPGSCSVTLLRCFKINHAGSIYTKEIGKCYK